VSMVPGNPRVDFASTLATDCSIRTAVA
jgi:hypothetical protein